MRLYCILSVVRRHNGAKLFGGVLEQCLGFKACLLLQVLVLDEKTKHTFLIGPFLL